jgi:hypothetical protein
MAWVNGVTRASADIISASDWNGYFGSSGDINLTAPYYASAAADIFQATGSKVIARLAKGTAYQQLQANSSANAVEWADSPTKLLDEKGELLVTAGSNVLAALGKGTNDYVLEARASATNGVQWVALSAGDAGANPEGLFPVIADQTYTGVFSSALVANRGYYWPLQSVQQSATITTYQGQGHRCYYLDAGSFALPSSVTMSATTQSHGPTGGTFKLSTGIIDAA